MSINNLASTASKIEPRKFVDFLRIDGWREFPVKNPKIKVFQKERGGELFQATIPLDRDLGDFNSALLDAIEAVANSRGETLEQIAFELLNPISDVLRFALGKN